MQTSADKLTNIRGNKIATSNDNTTTQHRIIKSKSCRKGVSVVETSNIGVGSNDGLVSFLFVLKPYIWHQCHINSFGCFACSSNVIRIMRWHVLSARDTPQKFSGTKRANMPVNCIPQGLSAVNSLELIPWDQGHLSDKELIF